LLIVVTSAGLLLDSVNRASNYELLGLKKCDNSNETREIFHLQLEPKSGLFFFKPQPIESCLTYDWFTLRNYVWLFTIPLVVFFLIPVQALELSNVRLYHKEKKGFLEKSKSKLVITNFINPKYSPFGIFETKAEYSLQDMARDLNTLMVEESRKSPSLYVYDLNGFVTRYGENNIFDFRQFHYGDIKVALYYVPYLAEDLMGHIKPASGTNRKCIVLDLDNTLRGGIVREDGFDGIKLGPKSPGSAYIEFPAPLVVVAPTRIILKCSIIYRGS
jgi:hypothetical protein